MAKLQDAQAPYLTLTEQASAPASPAAGDQRLYTKTDGKLYRKDDAGTETEVGGSSGSGVQAAAAVYTVTGVSIASGTITVIPFDLEDADASGFHDPASNPSRLTVPAGLGGLYLVTGQYGFVRGSGTAAGERTAIIRKNGSDFAFGGLPDAGGGTTSVILPTVTALVPLAAGDYVELFAYQNSGATVTTYTSANRRYVRFSIVRVAN